MSIKILQLNIFQGKFIDRIIDFIKERDIDILNFQEVTGGKMSKGGQNIYPEGVQFTPQPINEASRGADSLRKISESLGYKYEFLKTMGYENEPDSYHGIATFYNTAISLEKSETIYMHPYSEIAPDFVNWQDVGRGAIINHFVNNEKEFYAINTHLAWGKNPFDEEYKINQARLLFDKIKNIDKPLILTGDFNVLAETKTARMFEKIGKNQIKQNGITNTLNPVIHGSKQFFPAGLAVDHVFISAGIKVIKFEVIEDNLSDHFGLFTELKI